MSTEFIHVAQFIQTIFCFSFLILIGQRFVMTWKNLDQKYMHQRVKQLQEEIQWEKQHLKSSTVQSAPKQQQNKQQEKAQPPKQQHLRSSLVNNEHNQTNRKMSQNDEQSQRKSYKRKSLTDLRKEQQINSKQVEIKDQSDSATERKKSIDSKDSQNPNRRITNEIEYPKLNDLNSQQPSIASNYSNQDQNLKRHVIVNTKIHIFNLIDTVFNEHLPILMSILILGILVRSTYIFVMICLFGYVFTHLLLKYRNSMAQLRNQQISQSSISKLAQLLPKLWIIAIFISYWADKQYA